MKCIIIAALNTAQLSACCIALILCSNHAFHLDPFLCHLNMELVKAFVRICVHYSGETLIIPIVAERQRFLSLIQNEAKHQTGTIVRKNTQHLK